MAQITIYLDDEVLNQVRKATQSAGVSRSKWIAEAIQLRMRTEWTDSVRALAGSWMDFPTAEEIRAKHAHNTFEFRRVRGLRIEDWF